VETSPPGLIILIDEVQAGRSPVGPIWIPAKTVRVRALRDDPRAFDSAADGTQAVVRPGVTTRLFLDLRPSVVLRTTPDPARVYRVTGSPRDSLLGETPLSLAPSLLDGSRFRIQARDHADTVVTGESLIALAGSGRGAGVFLRRVAESIPATPAKVAFHRKRWVQWSLVGVGALLTGTAAILRREGDQWYDRYLDSSDRGVLDTYFDRAVRYDRFSLASLGAGQVLFTGGLVLLVSGSGR
jgi:hypothetical protein